MSAPGTRPPLLLVATLLAFTAFLGLLLAQSFAPRHVQVFSPSASDALPPLRQPGDVDTVTLDARDADRWRFFDLDRGASLTPPDTADWDLAVRRFRVIAGAGGAADLGPAAFDTVLAAPAAGYVRTGFAGEPGNDALAHWYRYSFFSHVLRPNGHVFAVRTSAGRYAKLEILSYYCPGPDAGCLTFRYAVSTAPGRSFR